MKKSLAKITCILLAAAIIMSTFVAAFAAPTGGQYTLTFDANGGTDAPEAQQSDLNGVITITKDEPVRSGFDFRGWKYDTDPEEEPNPELKPGNTITLTESKTAKALWGHRLEYHASLFTGDEDDEVFGKYTEIVEGYNPLTGIVRKISYENGNITLMKNMPIYEDEKGSLTFRGWTWTKPTSDNPFPEPDFTKDDILNGVTISINGTAKLYASWGVSVIYDFNGGKNGSDNEPFYDTKPLVLSPSTSTDPATSTNAATATDAYSADFTILDIEPTRSQMLFDDWNNVKDPRDTVSDTQNPSLKYRKDYKYENEKYRGDVYNPPYQNAYDFEKGDKVTLGRDLIIYAVWLKKLTYNANGGENAPDISISDGAGNVLITKNKPTWDGHVFLGWSFDKNATEADPELAADSKININDESVVVYAVWKVAIELNYNANGGKNAPAATFSDAEGNVTISETVPTKEGFKFAGWRYETDPDLPNPDLAPGKTINIKQNTTLYAVWGEYELTYDANKGVNPPASQVTNSSGVIKVSSDEPTRAGYIFLGWSYAATATEPDFMPGDTIGETTPITEDKIAYAVWGTGLSYDTNGGEPKPETVIVSDFTGQVVVTITDATPTKEGYVFLGWGDKINDATPKYNVNDSDTTNDTITLTQSKTIYAIWGLKLNYDANGGENPPEYSLSDGKGKVTITDKEPTNGDYIFLGWVSETNTNDVLAAGDRITITKETTVYAVWGGNLKFDPNGGDNAPNPIIDKGEINLPADKPTKKGYTLIGWDSSATATEPTYELWEEYETGKFRRKDAVYNFDDSATGNETLYAVWGAKLTYNANGGKQAPGFAIAKIGDSVTITSDEPLRTGYTFRGWSTNEQATEAEYSAGGAITVTKDRTLYAVWIKSSDVPKEYTISYDANGGDHAPASGKYSGTFNLPTDTPTREGYTFLGWSESKTATTPKYRGGDAFTLGKDTVLYAVWKQNDNSYLNNPNWTDMSTSQMNSKFDELKADRDPYSQEEFEDKYIAVFYSENSDRSKNIGTGLLTQWMDEYDCPLYGVNIHDDKNNIPDWARLAYAKKYNGKEINPSVVAFVERIELKDGRGNVIKAITNFELYNDPASVKDYIDKYNAAQTDDTKKIVTDDHFNDIYAIATTESRYSEFEYILDGLDFEDTAKEKELKDEFFDFWGYAGEYTLTYDANANDVSNLPECFGDDDDEILEPGNYTLSVQVPERAGYDFDGWSENSGAKNGEYKPGAKYFVDGETKDITLYAVWKHNPLAFREQDNWHEATRDQIDELYYSEKKGDKSDDFIVYFYDPTSEDCKTIGTTVIAPWITADDGAPDTRENPDGYGYEVYGVDIRNYSIPDWAYGEGSTSVSVPMISFVGYWDHPDPSDKRADEDLPKVKAFSGLSSGGKENLSSIDPVDTYFLTFAENTETEKYELKYDSNGANVTIDSQLGYGIVTLSAENPEYPLDGSEDTGYKFLGWSDDATARLADYKKGDKFNLYENTTLYAIWQKNPEKKYTITYQVEEDAYGPIDLQAEKGWVTLSGVTPTRKGYTFVEWSDVATGKTYKPGADFFLDKDVTLKAMWNYTSKEYTLTFDLDGGDSQARPFPPVTGSGYISLPVDKPVRDDYTFLGWSTTKGGSAQYDAGASFNLTANTTLYAVWEYAHETGGTITYFANGGVFKIDGNTKTNFTESVYKNEDITLTSVKPTRAGYTFLGWSESATAKSARYRAGGNFYVEGDKNVKLYAVWIDNETLLKVLTLEKSEFTVTTGEAITVPYRVNTDYDYLTLVAETPDEDVVAVSNNNGESFVITAKGTGEKVITLTLYDKDTGEVYAVRYINVTVQKPERFSFWKWLISIFRKIFSWFKPLFS